MKTIKSALLGTRNLNDSNESALLINLRDILKAHRELILSRLISDIPTYLDYKFNIRPDKAMYQRVKQELMVLKNSGVDLDNYSAFVNQVLSQPVTQLTNEPFYKEIDSVLQFHVRPAVMKIF